VDVETNQKRMMERRTKAYPVLKFLMSTPSYPAVVFLHHNNKPSSDDLSVKKQKMNKKVSHGTLARCKMLRREYNNRVEGCIPPSLITAIRYFLYNVHKNPRMSFLLQSTISARWSETW
jgi:hypothetical protein